MPNNEQITTINPKYLIIPILIIGAIFYFAPSNQTAGFIIILFLFVIGFGVGAKSHLTTLRQMRDTPKSTIRGASQGAVEISGYVQSDKIENDKAYLNYKLKKQTIESKTWELVASFKSHGDYLLLEDKGARCWIDLNSVDFYGNTKRVEIQASEIPTFLKSHPYLSEHKEALSDASMISLEEESLPSKGKVYAVGDFSSNPSNKPPNYLKKEEETAWNRIASEAEGVEIGEPLKGIAMVNTLIWSNQGNISTPVILSVHSESALKRKIWFKFWLIIFCLLVFLAIPTILVLQNFL